MLARIKLTYPQICDSIWTIDDHRLTVDNLMAIRQYIPTKEEIEMIQDYTGDGDTLGNAEKYFKTVSYTYMYIKKTTLPLAFMINNYTFFFFFFRLWIFLD